MRGVQLEEEEAKEHSPKITGVSVEETSVN
jgi:hypothetical protein